jgi:cytochrome c peroxidase
MKTERFVKLSLFVLCTLTWFSCENNRDHFVMEYPDYFPLPQYQFGNNVLTREGFELGKSLFFDPILSIDSIVSCASCHAQVHAFADHNTALSFGIFNRVGIRNSPAIINAAWHTSFMWDGGINHIEVMPFGPITNEVEMGEDLANVVSKLNRHKEYSRLFAETFGKRPVHSQQVLYALAQYMSMLISCDSKYDRVRQGKAAFEKEEEAGYIVFQSKCASCHQEPLFTDFSFRNNGLSVQNGDIGRGKITLDPRDNYKFKVPTLRNITLTYPYMHDGSLRTLSDVLNHYDNGMTANNNLDPEFLQHEKTGIPLNETEKRQLLAFLQTLTDYTFISNPLFSK